MLFSVILDVSQDLSDVCHPDHQGLIPGTETEARDWFENQNLDYIHLSHYYNLSLKYPREMGEAFKFMGIKTSVREQERLHNALTV